MSDLLGEIEMPQCECKNMAKGHTLRHCMEADTRENPGFFLESDADEELLIVVKFMQAVKISSIQINGTDEADHSPKEMVLFVNPMASLDFDSAKTDKPTQTITLTKENVLPGAKAVDLRCALERARSILQWHAAVFSLVSVVWRRRALSKRAVAGHFHPWQLG